MSKRPLFTEEVKLQVPMRKAAHEAIKKRAEALGFDSVQAYVRYWATAEGPKVEGRKTEKAPRAVDTPAGQALRFLELLLATKQPELKSLEEALQYVVKELRRMEGRRYLQALLYE